MESLYKADTIGAGKKLSVRTLYKDFFVRVWPEISLFRYKNGVLYIKVSALNHVHFKEIPQYEVIATPIIESTEHSVVMIS